MVTTDKEGALTERITIDPKIFRGKPIIRGRRLAVEHVLGILAAGDWPETILAGYPWPEPEDLQACALSMRAGRWRTSCSNLWWFGWTRETSVRCARMNSGTSEGKGRCLS